MVFYGSDDSEQETYSGVATTDLTLCIGLVVAFIIFLAVVLIIIKLLKKKSHRQNNSGYTLTSAGEVLS